MTKETKENTEYLGRTSQRVEGKIGGRGKEESFERRSEEYSIAVSGSSNGDKDNFSCFSEAKFDDSVSLQNSCASNKVVEKTLNFSRKTNRTTHKGHNPTTAKNEQGQTCYFSEVSELCMMAKELKSSL
jgi:hypothetical protein